MQVLQAVIFCGGLLFAAVYDIRTRTVSDGVCIGIALAGLISISPASFLGALMCFALFYIGSGFGKNGAGDITLGAAAGFVLGASRTMAGLTLSFVLYGFYVLGDALIAKLRHRPCAKSCPLVPFLAAGFIPAYFFA